MSRFIPEGKSDLKSLQKSESEAANKFAAEKEEEEAVSLYDQMKANYIAKEREYEEKVRSKNQSHKINERELEFYQKLEMKQKEKDLERKRELEEGLEEFERKKKANTMNTSEKSSDTNEKTLPIPEFDVSKQIKIVKPGKFMKVIKPPKPEELPGNKTKKNKTPETEKDEAVEKKAPSPAAIISGYSSSESDSE